MYDNVNKLSNPSQPALHHASARFSHAGCPHVVFHLLFFNSHKLRGNVSLQLSKHTKQTGKRYMAASPLQGTEVSRSRAASQGFVRDRRKTCRKTGTDQRVLRRNSADLGRMSLVQ